MEEMLPQPAATSKQGFELNGFRLQHFNSSSWNFPARKAVPRRRHHVDRPRFDPVDHNRILSVVGSGARHVQQGKEVPDGRHAQRCIIAPMPDVSNCSTSPLNWRASHPAIAASRPATGKGA
jgi:hypothetical protein